MKNLQFLFTIVLTLSINFTFCQSGSLDPTFGNNGIVITDFINSDDHLTALEIQPDQKIIAVGWKYGLGQFLACRYNTDGTLDTGFGENGLFTVIPPEIVVCHAAALQNDGKIIMGGTRPIFIIPTKSDEEDLMLMRLKTDGKIDSTFGTDGIVITDLGGHFERIEEVLIQADGKILVAGEGADNIEGGFFYLVRYDGSGQLDPTFGNQGIKKIYEVFTVNTMVLQQDGKILIGGYGDLGLTVDFDLRRFKSDGTIDDTFGNGGRVISDLSGQRDIVLGISPEPDGRIFVSGGANVSGSIADLAFARYYPDGSLDESYGNNGFEIISLPPYAIVTDMAMQPDGKYVLCGSSNHLDGEFHVMLIRIKHDGGLDESFGDQGIVYTVSPESYHGASELVIQNNNYVVLGGVSAESGVGSDFTLSRYIVDDVISATDENNEAVSLVTSPNPCKDFFSIETGRPFDEFHCTICNLSGHLIHDKSICADAAGRLKIDTKSFVPGQYSVILENKDMRSSTSIVIQH